ncbi:unnamed protein product [Didymodactylos carnosus]|uniref:Uncharacterized protein n=1 Tax=Didymodactylos carnosus TaxID=1234261 RepID=A0A816B2M9_9BILA|nr:unnamed protein product [Didymodactylos carnosus]CAF4372289.1 unnamed protein product [Didymodactylos carnosus]CAF4483867.1 unnamed protein product [Didymodactylos carnosus]
MEPSRYPQQVTSRRYYQPNRLAGQRPIIIDTIRTTPTSSISLTPSPSPSLFEWDEVSVHSRTRYRCGAFSLWQCCTGLIVLLLFAASIAIPLAVITSKNSNDSSSTVASGKLTQQRRIHLFQQTRVHLSQQP